jgi:hypothetical protein
MNAAGFPQSKDYEVVGRLSRGSIAVFSSSQPPQDFGPEQTNDETSLPVNVVGSPPTPNSGTGAGSGDSGSDIGGESA